MVCTRRLFQARVRNGIVQFLRVVFLCHDGDVLNMVGYTLNRLSQSVMDKIDRCAILMSDPIWTLIAKRVLGYRIHDRFLARSGGKASIGIFFIP